MTATAAKWSKRVEEWRASGKTATDFARGFDFEATTLRYWSSRLKTMVVETPGPTLARVVRRQTHDSVSGAIARDPSARAELELMIGGVRVVVRRDFDAELLRQVASALGTAR